MDEHEPRDGFFYEEYRHPNLRHDVVPVSASSPRVLGPLSWAEVKFFRQAMNELHELIGLDSGVIQLAEFQGYEFPLDVPYPAWAHR